MLFTTPPYITRILQELCSHTELVLCNRALYRRHTSLLIFLFEWLTYILQRLITHDLLLYEIVKLNLIF